jgi:hypothetical protein
VSIFDKAKGMAGRLADKVKGKLDRDDSGKPAPAAEDTSTIPDGGAITPADVAESVSNPDLAHPEQPTDEPDGGGRPA